MLIREGLKQNCYLYSFCRSYLFRYLQFHKLSNFCCGNKNSTLIIAHQRKFLK